MTGRWVVGVDSGGTFTDLVAIDGSSGDVVVAKVPSTPARPIDAVRAALAESGVLPGLARFVHGTTVATNAVLERRGARLCLLTTAGFEDVPYIQRLNRRYAFDLSWQKPAPLVERRLTIGVRERIAPHGVVVEPLDENELDRVVASVRSLAESGEIDAVAVSLLFSFANDAHERALERRLADELPGLPVSISSRVSPLWREYERVSTTLADAYVRPLIATYLRELDSAVDGRGAGAPVLLLKSNGGTGSPQSIEPAPVTMLLSGLAGGAVGAAYFAAAAGEERCITLDVGGTSTDVGLVVDGGVRQLNEFEIEWGLPVATPCVDVRAIGAGGGSIARVDAGGLIQVGPQSAGAVPGPAAYGLGGSDPTVTDANLVLGRLNPSYFLGGRIQLDVPAAEAAIERLGEAAGLDPLRAALAVVDIANENVANAIRLLTIERGLDPREYTLVAFGGAGPLIACGVADAVGIARVVVPPHPGLCSAFGAAIAPLRVDRVWSLGARSDRIDEETLRAAFTSAEHEAHEELRRDGVPAEADVEVRRSIACRYYLQNYEEEVPVEDLEPGFVDRAAAGFHRVFRAFYGYAFENEPVELVHCKVTAREARAEERVRLAPHEPARPAGDRVVVGPEGEREPTRVLRRGVLGAEEAGPLLIEEPDSTVYVPRGWVARDGEDGSLVLARA